MSNPDPVPVTGTGINQIPDSQNGVVNPAISDGDNSKADSSGPKVKYPKKVVPEPETSQPVMPIGLMGIITKATMNSLDAERAQKAVDWGIIPDIHSYDSQAEATLKSAESYLNLFIQSGTNVDLNGFGDISRNLPLAIAIAQFKRMNQVAG